MNEADVRVIGTLAGLPSSMTGHRNVVWWGNFGFMLIEGVAFLLAMGAYLYLTGRPATWPPPGDLPPDHLWGAVFTLALLLSMMPNLVLLKVAKDKRPAPVRWLALLLCAMGIGLIVVRGFEFAHLNVTWHQDAYGSVVWMLMVLHTTHLLTELGETGAQTLWLFTHEIGDDQFADVEDDSNYWTFVVLAWLPLYGMVYWLPRLL